jgi:hypothetical protein
MFGSLLSPSFKAEPPSPDDNKIASIVWGATLGIGSLTVWKAVEQTIVIWRRKRFTRSLYIWMVWLLLVVIMMSSGLCWYFMEGKIAPG